MVAVIIAVVWNVHATYTIDLAWVAFLAGTISPLIAGLATKLSAGTGVKAVVGFVVAGNRPFFWVWPENSPGPGLKAPPSHGGVLGGNRPGRPSGRSR